MLLKDLIKFSSDWSFWIGRSPLFG